MALRPGTTATRADIADIERAMSSARPITRDDLMPGAGSSSYRVTTGPGRTFMISPLTPKSSSTPSSRRAFCSSASVEILPDAFFGSASIMSGGITHSPRGEKANFNWASATAREPGFSGPAAAATRATGAAATMDGVAFGRGA